MEKVVVSLGGSVIVPDHNDAAFLSELTSLISDLSSTYQIYLVCGGGKVARYYISVGRELGMREHDLDMMGIMATRANAKLVSMALGDLAVKTIPTEVKEAHMLTQENKVVVMGGTVPGHTTDAVSAMLAEEVGASRIVNATSVDAAYTADPRKYPDARRLGRISFKELYDLVNVGRHGAGPSNVFDRSGTEIAMRKGISIYIVDGRNVEELRKAIQGQEVQGTVVGH